MLPVRSPAVARQCAGELDAMHLPAGPGSGRARPRHGPCTGRLQSLPRPVPADRVLRAAARPRAPAAYRLGDRTGSPALSASATTARATATAAGRSGAATQTTQMISLAVCALTTLAFLLDGAWLAAAAKAAGSGWWPSSLPTRTVTSYRLGGLSMPGTVGVVYDISGADLVISCRGAGHLGRECAALAAGPLSGGLPTLRDDGPVAAVVTGRRVCPCCRGERPDPGRGADRGAAARGSTTAPGCRGGDRASG